MASIGESVRRILTQPGHDPMEQLLYSAKSDWEGDQELTQAAAVTQVASLSVSRAFVFSPPSDQSETEWIVEGIVVKDTAGVDVNDLIAILLEDLIINAQFPILLSKPNASSSVFPENVLWPRSGDLAVGNIFLHYTPLRLFRKVNGEAWRQLRVDLTTTATVGTRNFVAALLYRRRPSTRI